MSTLLTIFHLITLLALSERSQAFPDTIRHGYVNCSTCHVSPAGGGLLTSYGRSLSRELLSTWGYKGEEQPLHGAVTIPEKFNEHFALGGDIRYLNRRQQTKSRALKEDFLMQAQLRAGLLFEKIKFVAAVGRIENPRKSEKVVLDAPEYFALWTPREEVHVRLGRFQPIYGLRLPDHGLWIRSDLGFAPWVERDTSEVIFEGESTTMSLAGFLSTSATSFTQQSTGYTGSIFQTLGEKTRLGLSALNSEGQGTRTKVLTTHAVLPFSEAFYALAEYSRIWNLTEVHDLGFSRLGYEAVKGLTVFAQGQLKVDRLGGQGTQSKTGVGAQWLPRPHFEISAIFESLKSRQGDASENYILFHYYL